VHDFVSEYLGEGEAGLEIGGNFQERDLEQKASQPRKCSRYPGCECMKFLANKVQSVHSLKNHQKKDNSFPMPTGEGKIQ
jgi:hypothetical protein